MGASNEITGVLERSSEKELIRLVVPEMKRLARRCLRPEHQSGILKPAALMNEAYLLLIEGKNERCKDRSHFFALAARIMRNILVDYARRKLRSNREGGSASRTCGEIVELNDALDEFSRLDPRKAKVVELRFFGGMSVEGTADVLKISPDTVIRDWSLARAWLQRQGRR
jgi:RNA polymerase sigma-70 factor (ECF subfamily)